MMTNPLLLVDGYKVGHVHQYPKGTTMVYSNFTPRATRTDRHKVVFFGLQYFVLEYLVRQFNQNFFARPKDEVMREYRRRIDSYLGPGFNCDHIAQLHDLGYLPLKVKALPEGTEVPIRVPMLTIRNTRPEAFWVTNALETLMSNVLWGPCTSATTARAYRWTFDLFASTTGGDPDFVPLQGHDFSFRGLTGVENAALSGAAHLLSFIGTDSVPAIDLLEKYYGADVEREVVGVSVPATEHSVMCMGEKDTELSTFQRLITEVYPTGIVSIVSDTWDLWQVLTHHLPVLKGLIMQRDGKVVIRPDSGDPEKIICGEDESPHGEAARKGVLQLLWETFGGTINKDGFRVLDPHVGLIYGEAITHERQRSILNHMMENGFASTNIVFGIGSYTYNYVTRDTFGFAIKSTYGEIDGRAVPIFKDPVTDTGLKKSATGLLRVDLEGDPPFERFTVRENVSWDEEAGGALETVFEDGEVKRLQTLSDIRERLNG